MRPGGFSSLILIACSGFFALAALECAGATYPFMFLGCWVAITLTEYAISASTRSIPVLERDETGVVATFPRRPLVGGVSAATMALVVGSIAAWTLPPVLAALVSAGTFAAVTFALLRLGQRDVTLSLDPTTRKLTATRKGFRVSEVHLGEIAGIRHEDGTLHVEHAHGTETFALREVEWDQLEWVARELDAVAREMGADPDVHENRRRAQQALAAAKRTE